VVVDNGAPPGYAGTGSSAISPAEDAAATPWCGHRCSRFAFRFTSLLTRFAHTATGITADVSLYYILSHSAAAAFQMLNTRSDASCLSLNIDLQLSANVFRRGKANAMAKPDIVG